MQRQEILDLLKPITIVQVLDIKKHPNADRLLIVNVNLGTEIKDVITGANNFKAGDYVPYLGMGNVIPGYLLMKGEKIILEKRKLRGLDSDSMILAEDEIGLSNDHQGIYIVHYEPDLTTNIVGRSLIEFLTTEQIDKIVHNALSTNTASSDELLDLVNKDDNVIGTVLKSAAHKNPELIHREIAVVILNSKRQTLVQQRSLKKKVSPGAWKIVAGHVDAGEDPKAAAIREVKEEIGIDLDPIFFEKQFEKNEKNSESKFYYVYYAFYEDDKFTLDKDEVNDVKWIDIDQMEEFSKEHDDSLKDRIIDTTNRIVQKLNI